MTISIRAHCIPAYDILSNLRKVLEIPPEIDSMEEKTAGGIVKSIVCSIVNIGQIFQMKKSFKVVV